MLRKGCKARLDCCHAVLLWVLPILYCSEQKVPVSAGAPGRLRKAREAQAATSANAFHGNMHGNQSSGSVSFKIDKKENQFSQANSTRNLKKHVTYNSGMGDSIGRGKGVLFSQSTRQQELRCSVPLCYIHNYIDIGFPESYSQLLL